MSGMNAKERLESLIQYLHTNMRTFGEMVGYDRPQALYDVQKGKTRNISPTMCEKILTAFPKINRVWLLTGEGPMIETENPDDSATCSAPDLQKVPFVMNLTNGGPLHEYYQEGVKLDLCEKIISPTPDADLAIPICGDSMEPIFLNGTIIYIKRLKEKAFIPWGSPLVLDTVNGIFIKVVLPDPTNDEIIMADSYNPRYPRMRIPKSAIYGMYRVLMGTKHFTTM